MKQERMVKEELMSQDDEEDIPVTEREMNLKVTLRKNQIRSLFFVSYHCHLLSKKL